MSLPSGVRWKRVGKDNGGVQPGCGTKSHPCLCIWVVVILQVKSCLCPESRELFSFSSAACECSCSLKFFLNNALQVLCCPPSTLSTNNGLGLRQELNFIHICKNIKTKHTGLSCQSWQQTCWVPRQRLSETFPFPSHIVGTFHLCFISPLLPPPQFPVAWSSSFLWICKTCLAHNRRAITGFNGEPQILRQEK